MRIEWTDQEKANYQFTKGMQKRAYDSFFKENQESKWDLYAITVTFRGSSETKYTEEKCLHIYDTRVLWKIAKEFKRNVKDITDVIEFPYYRFHEYEEKNKSKIDNQRNPNHIHGLLTIPKELSHKFWDFKKGRLSERVQKDILTVDYVASCLIEEARMEDLDQWTTYILKQKNLFQ